MADKSEDDETNTIANRRLERLDSLSSEQSKSSICSIKSIIKISQRDLLRFDGMIGHSDVSDDDSVLNQENCVTKNMANDIASNDMSIEEKDFSPSDGSDYDPKKHDHSSDDSDKVTDNEDSDDPLITEITKSLKRKQKRRCEQFHRDEEDKKNEKLIQEKVMTPTQKKGSEDTSNEVNIKEQEKGSEETSNEVNIKENTEKRVWNRRNACFYCQELVTNYSRHLLRHHAKEIEIIKYQSINDPDPKIRKQKRQAITDKLRNKGNFLHNSKVSYDRDGESTLLPSKRNLKVTSSPSGYATCKTCLGTFKRTSFFRHFKKCGPQNKENELPLAKRRVLFNHSITIIPNTANASVELKENILSHLRADEISLVVKNDPLIIAYGSRLLKKKKERRSRKAICSKMRDLATLLTIIRKRDTSIETLSDVLEPDKYETFIDGIKKMCGFDEQTGTVNVPSIPARMRPAILGCIEILYTQSLMSTESTAFKEAYKNKLDDFKRLIEINWQWEISSNAEKTRKRINMTKENVIPLDEDIATVFRKIQKLEIKYGAKLRTDRNVLNYETLCTVTIAHIIMLDRKRAGDVAEAELTFYINRKNEEVPEKVLETLTAGQKKSINDLDVFQIPGKRTRAVPILLTKTMRENIDLIVACREDMNIPSSNRYLFARPGTEEPFDGGKCLDKIKKRCNLKRPEMLTSTGMRHHIATMSQIHAKQNDQYTEHLAGFLGHDVAVHAKNYRLPMQVLQKAVVGTQLMEYENIANKHTITSHADLFEEKQDQIISDTRRPLGESEPPSSFTQNPDETNITPDFTTHIRNANEELENADENQEPEITYRNEEPECTNKNQQPEITNTNKEPENTNEYRSMTDQTKNMGRSGNEPDKHQRTKEDIEYTSQITTGKKTTRFVKRKIIETATHDSSLSNNDEDQIHITNFEIQKKKRLRKMSPSNENNDDPVKMNMPKRSLRTTHAKVNPSMKKIKANDSSYSSESSNHSENYKNKPNRNKTQIKKKKNRVSSSSDGDEQKPRQKRNKTTIQIKKKKSKESVSSDSDDEKHLPKRNKTTHKKWSDEEIKVVKKNFQSYIKNKINPGKRVCSEILNKEPVLRNRTWMQLNSYVNNIYKKK